jgi:hypothetical protein
MSKKCKPGKEISLFSGRCVKVCKHDETRDPDTGKCMKRKSPSRSPSKSPRRRRAKSPSRSPSKKQAQQSPSKSPRRRVKSPKQSPSKDFGPDEIEKIMNMIETKEYKLIATILYQRDNLAFGDLYINQNGVFYKRTWMGKIEITRNRELYGDIYGKFIPSKKIPAKDIKMVEEMMINFTMNPSTFKGTHCFFCKRQLKDPASLEFGYGPDCAKNLRLPFKRET